MLLDHILMMSVDLASRLMVYKQTPCNKTTVNLVRFYLLRTILRVGRTMSWTDRYFETGL